MLLTTDEIGSKYNVLLDRDSAQEMLAAKTAESSAAAAAIQAKTAEEKAAAVQAKADAVAQREALRVQREQERLDTQRQHEAEREQARAAREAAKPSMADKMIQSAGRAVASSVGRQFGNTLLRGILGGLLRGR